MQKAPRRWGYNIDIVMYFLWLRGQDTVKHLH